MRLLLLGEYHDSRRACDSVLRDALQSRRFSGTLPRGHDEFFKFYEVAEWL
jgi:hypothetical protein